MTRQIVLDTETTGIDFKSGHRVIEIGCVEIVNRKFTGSEYQTYLNPDRESEEGALKVHGLTFEFFSFNKGPCSANSITGNVFLFSTSLFEIKKFLLSIEPLKGIPIWYNKSLPKSW